MTTTNYERLKFRVEIISLIVTTGLALIIFIFGKRIATTQWTNQKLVEKRISLYDSIMPLLNDLLCYHTHVGNFKELSPSDIVLRKRKLDKIFYTQKAFLGNKFENEYNQYINLCFLTNSGWLEDAKIKSQIKSRKEIFSKFHNEIIKDSLAWDNMWDKGFTDTVSESEKIKSSYNNLMNILGKDIGLK